MHAFSGKRFVTKISDTDVLLDDFYTKDGERKEIYGNLWGIWDKQEKKWVHESPGVIAEDTNRSVMLDLADGLNENGYYNGYHAGQ